MPNNKIYGENSTIKQQSTFLKLAQAAKITGLHKLTIQRYAKANKIKSIILPSGRKKYDVSSLIPENQLSNFKTNIEERNICYCRVSIYGQKNDLDSQINYMKKKYPNYEIIYDIASGINFKRNGIKKIIDYAINGNLKTLVISYKDRLCRIGYELLEYIFLTYSNTNIIIDSEKPETINEEIANDILEIITVYSAKIHGMRSYNTDKK